MACLLRPSHVRTGRVGVSLLLLVLCFLGSHCDLMSAQLPPPVVPTGSSPSPPVPTTSNLPAINVTAIDPTFFQYPPTMSYLDAKPGKYTTFTRLLKFPNDKGLSGSYAIQIVEAAKLNITLLVPIESAWIALGNAVSCLEQNGAYNLTDKIIRNHIILGLHNATELRLNPISYPTAGDTPVSIASLPTGITANGVNVMVPDKFLTYGGVVLDVDRVILPEDFGSQWQAACPTIPSVSPPPAVASVPGSEIIPAPVSAAGSLAPGEAESIPVPPTGANPADQSGSVGVLDGAGAGGSDGMEAPGSQLPFKENLGSSSLNKDGLFSFALKLLVTAAVVWTAYSS